MDAFELIPIDEPTTPLVTEAEKQEENRNPSWFKPGQSGNPNGRPHKGYSITEAVKDLLTKNPERKKKIIEKIIALAEGGDPVFVKLAWNYMDGMPNQKTDITSGGDKLEPIQVIIKDYGTDDNSTT